MTPELRDKDRAVLHAITEGENDTQKIKQATTLENHEIRYSLEKLEKHQLIEITRPEGMVERVIDGQKRVFQHPKQAQLTDKGKRHYEEADQEELERYEDQSHRELVDKVHQLENRIQALEQKFEMFRKQVQKKLN